MILDAVKAAILLVLTAIVQVTFVNVFEFAEGRADIVLLALVGLALLRGPIFGACAGFLAGLVLDTATLGTLGLTSLLLTLAGYWAGRFGEATSHQANQRARILVAVTVFTVAFCLGALVLHVLLGESASLGHVLSRTLLPTLLLNVLLAVPSFALLRRLFPPPPSRRERGQVAVV